MNAADNFQLQFTLLGVDGVNTPGTGGTLVVGAWVNDGYQMKMIDLGSTYGTTAISSTVVGTYGVRTIYEIGFTTRLYVDDGGWSPSGTTITLLVQPAPGAVQIPEPASLTLTSAGALVVLARRARREFNHGLRGWARIRTEKKAPLVLSV